MLSGFIPGSRAPFMMDVVATAILVVLPGLAAAIWLAKNRHYAWHKRVIQVLTTALAVVVTLFEIDVRTHDWLPFAAPSPYFQTWLFPVFYVHLTMSISLTLLWIGTFATAIRRFPNPPRPSQFSAVHRVLAWSTSAVMLGTAVTGWLFYYVAFLA